MFCFFGDNIDALAYLLKNGYQIKLNSFTLIRRLQPHQILLTVSRSMHIAIPFAVVNMLSFCVKD